MSDFFWYIAPILWIALYSGVALIVGCRVWAHMHYTVWKLHEHTGYRSMAYTDRVFGSRSLGILGGVFWPAIAVLLPAALIWRWVNAGAKLTAPPRAIRKALTAKEQQKRIDDLEYELNLKGATP